MILSMTRHDKEISGDIYRSRRMVDRYACVTEVFDAPSSAVRRIRKEGKSISLSTGLVGLFMFDDHLSYSLF